jgi:sialic acid synthase SpsE
MKDYVEIDGVKIGEGYPTYIIAEMSANHLQDFERAKAIIRTAKEIGADAVKLQSYRPDTITLDSNRPEFMAVEGSLWEGRSLYDLYHKR